MTDKILDIIATPDLMTEIVALAKRHGFEASAAMAVDSSSDALDSPLGVDELRQVMEVVTLIASSGTTVVGFLAALKALMKKSEKENGKEPKATVVDTLTRRTIGTVTAETNLEALEV